MTEITSLFEDVFRCPYCGTIISKAAMLSLVNRTTDDSPRHEFVTDVAKCPVCKNHSGIDED
jgi:rubredoxin